MPISVRVDSIDRDVDLIFKEMLSPQARSAMLAAAAREQLALAEQTNLSVLGRIPPHKTVVDGSVGTSEDAVTPTGTIAYEFDLLLGLFIWIADQLKELAPVGGRKDPHPGLYKRSFTFFADGVEVNVGGEIPPDAAEYTFLNAQPYSLMIERGQSKQAPDGVFQVVAALAQARFGNAAKIRFEYRSPLNGQLQTGRAGNQSSGRTPAISITVK